MFRDCVQLVTHVELPEWRRTDSSPEDELAIKGKKERLAELIQVRNTIYPSKTTWPSRKGLYTSLDHESVQFAANCQQHVCGSNLEKRLETYFKLQLQDEFDTLDGFKATVPKLVEQFVWDEEAAIEQRREELGLEHDAQDPVVPAPSDWYFQHYLRMFGRNMMPPNTPTAPDDLAEVIFPNLDISARQLEVVWSTVYQVRQRLGDANRLPFCSSVFNAGDLKLNRFLGLHLFLLQAISHRDRIVSETDEVPGVKPSKGFARTKVMEIWEHVHADDTESPVQDRILSKRFHSQVTHLLYKAWRDFALVEDGIEQGLRLLRDEDKGLKWTKKSQFGSEIRNVFQQVASSVKGREFKVKKNPPRNVKAASFSPLPTTSLGARFMYINTTALLEINNAIIDINTSAQERAHMSTTARNKTHMFKQKNIIYQTPKTPGADNTEEASRFCNTRDQLWRSWFSPAAVCGVQMYKDVQDQPYKDVDQYHRRVFDYIIYTDLES
ncbi:hypothetical protein SeLEV6574_g05888, partial [Synchytrium endobioticum]